MESWEFWLIAILISAIVAGALVIGSRRLASGTTGESVEPVLAIYRDQLAEIDRDVERGTLLPVAAEDQRAEVSRRLLAASRESQGPKSAGSAGATIWIALAVPAIAIATYALVGSPAVDDVPRAERLAQADAAGDLEALIVKVEEHLARNPGDARGWQLLIPNYFMLGRYSDAAAAIQYLISINGPDAELLASLAEALTLANQGIVTDEAAKAAVSVLALDAKNPRARFYEALDLTQDGKTQEALGKFEALLADSPGDAPWREAVMVEIAKLKAGGAKAPALSDQQIRDVQSLSPEAQGDMIRGMVDGLAQKLTQNPDDLEGWLRLIRARVVLKEQDNALAALDTARGLFREKSEALAALESLAAELALK